MFNNKYKLQIEPHQMRMNKKKTTGKSRIRKKIMFNNKNKLQIEPRF